MLIKFVVVDVDDFPVFDDVLVRLSLCALVVVVTPKTKYSSSVNVVYEADAVNATT